MPKKKKTREQKMLADKRRELGNQTLYTFISTPSKSQGELIPHASKQPAVAISTTSYRYLAGDLQKTLLFTTFIVVTELLVKYFLK